jgi:hypothetical protein
LYDKWGCAFAQSTGEVYMFDVTQEVQPSDFPYHKKLANEEADSYKVYKIEEQVMISDLMLFAVEGILHVACRHTDGNNSD